MDTRGVIAVILRFGLAWIAGALLSLPALTTALAVLSDSPGYPYIQDSAIEQAAIIAVIFATIVGFLLVRKNLSLTPLWKFTLIAFSLYAIAIQIVGSAIWPSQFAESAIVIKSYVLATGIASYVIADHYSYKKLERKVRTQLRR